MLSIGNTHTISQAKKIKTLYNGVFASIVMTDQPLRLLTYLTALKQAIDTTDKVWVICQIRAINTNKSGHYYFELADDDGEDQVVASIKGVLWRSHAALVLEKFRQNTQRQMQTGLSVMLYGQARLHPHYGLAFHISDVNPAHTIGKLLQEHHNKRQKLEEQGLLTRNKRHKMPFDLYQVAVIAPQHAAGLGDFQAQVSALYPVCNFSYHYATFQGNTAGDELGKALIAAQQTAPDLLVIIRGGGAVGDLAYLNDYELAVMVATSAIPVWTGIGHQRDQTLLDEVAHRSFDTPSKVAAAIQGHIIGVWQRAFDYIKTIKNHATLSVSNSYRQQKTQLKSIFATAHYHQNLQYHSTKTALDCLKSASIHHLASRKIALSHHLQKQKIAQYRLNQAKQNITHLQKTTLFYRPETTLARGYAMVYHQGQPIKTRQKTYPNQSLTISFFDGDVLVEVK